MARTSVNQSAPVNQKMFNDFLWIHVKWELIDWVIDRIITELSAVN
jgi:hypothetical protein